MHKSLTQSVRTMIERDGWYVVHIRVQKSYPCPLCGELYGGGSNREPNPRCVVCLGTGYLVTLAPLKVRASESARPEYDELKDTEIGIVGRKNIIFYALPEAKISDRDLLVEVTWSVPREQVLTRGRILTVHKLFEVNETEIKRGQRGEFAYYRLACHSRPADVRWISERLANRPTDADPYIYDENGVLIVDENYNPVTTD